VRPRRARLEEERVERVGTVLGELDRGTNLHQRLAEAQAFGNWSGIVGRELAARTRPLRLADGRLFVLAPGAALRQELTFHQRTILQRFNELAGQRIARTVVFLEADSLDYEAAARPEALEAPAAPPPTAGSAVEPEDGEAEPGLPADVGAMYEVFDAPAYRRELQRIAEGGARETR
jgi:hypothetical protein